MERIKYKKLNRGDTIGIVATSYPYPRDLDSEYYKQYKRGIETLQNLGFKTLESNYIRQIKWWFAGDAKIRATALNEMFANPEVKAIIVHEGGQSAISILKYLNYDLIRNNPKPLIGFSDITTLHLGIFTKTNLCCYQGPLSTYSLGKIWYESDEIIYKKSLDLFYNSLVSTKPIGVIKPFTEWSCWNNGCAEGTLFGGNLSRISALMGTEYFPKISNLKNIILFWEINDVSISKIQLYLEQLKYSGLMDNVVGMLIGKLPDIKNIEWNDIQVPTIKEVVLDVLGEYNFPILAEVDFGHKIATIPMIIGLKAKIDSSKLKFEVLDSLFSY